MSRRVAITVGVTVGLTLAAIVVATVATGMDRQDRNVQVELECVEDQCTATFDGKNSTSVRIPQSRFAKKLGFYVYHPWEREVQTRFKNLHIERTLVKLNPYELSLQKLDHAGYFNDLGDSGWALVAERGLQHEAPRGARAMALFAPPTESDFRLQVEIEDAVDAGIFFRGNSAETGWLLIVREAYNDAFFAFMYGGEVGEIVGLTPLRELTVEREAWRLAGLFSRIFVASMLLLGLLYGSAQFAADRVRRRSASDQPGRSRRRYRLIRVALFLATVIICASIGQGWMHGIPHIEDESAYMFQARLFAAGELWADAPTHPQFFEHEHLIVQGDRWFSKYPPLFSAFLALGLLLGAPWLVNPILAAATGWVVSRIAHDWLGPRWGLIAWALLLVSPFFTVMGATMMSHMLACLLTATFTWAVLRSCSGRSVRWALLAGAALGLALLTRPYTAFLFAVAAALPLLLHLWRARSAKRWLQIPALLLIGVLPALVLFFAWGQLHAEPGSEALNLYAQNNSSDTLGFGLDKGSTWLQTWGSTGHTPAKALRATHQYLDYSSTDLFGWPLGLSFAFVFAALIRGRRRSWMLALIPLALVGGHALYWATQHIAYGARYWFSAIPAMVLLSVAGMRALAARSRLAGSPVAPWATAVVLSLFVGLNLTLYLPQRLAELPNFGGISADLAKEVDRLQLDEEALVFVETQGLLFNDGFHMNDPANPRATLFARDFGPDNQPLIDQYPERPVWRWNGERLVPQERIASHVE